MTEIMMVRAVAVEFDMVEEALEDNLVAEAVEKNDKVAKAEVVAVALDKEDIT